MWGMTEAGVARNSKGVRSHETYRIAFIGKGTRQRSDAATARICCSHVTLLTCSLIAG